jgi:hypothetical protein
MVVSEWHIASYQKSLLSSLALLTSAIGAIAFGHIADKLGRRKIYGYEVLVLAAGAIATAFAPGIWWLIALRGVLGFGIGGDYPVSATIMSEYASKHNRGRMVALVFSMQGAGLVIGPLVAIALPRHRRRREDRRVRRHLRADRAAAGDRPQPDQRAGGGRRRPRPAGHPHYVARAQGQQPGGVHRGPGRELPSQRRGAGPGREPRHPATQRLRLAPASGGRRSQLAVSSAPRVASKRLMALSKPI